MRSPPQRTRRLADERAEEPSTPRPHPEQRPEENHGVDALAPLPRPIHALQPTLQRALVHPERGTNDAEEGGEGRGGSGAGRRCGGAGRSTPEPLSYSTMTCPSSARSMSASDPWLSMSALMWVRMTRRESSRWRFSRRVW